MARQYPPEQKAAAIAKLLTGSSPGAVARELGIPRTTVLRWRDGAQSVAPVGPQKREELGAQLWDYLTDSIATLGLQVRFFGNETWLEKQSAADLAILHGVLADKSVRLLAALRGEPVAGDGPR